jgi:DNA-binding MarR family transcriptional regulator
MQQMKDTINTVKENDKIYQVTVFNLISAHNSLIGRINESVNKFGMTSQQYNLLMILRSAYPNPMGVNEIRKQMVEKMSDASRIVARLVKKNLITRCTNKKDRRATDVTISEWGLILLAVLDKEFQISDLLKLSVSEAQIYYLNELLVRINICTASTS